MINFSAYIMSIVGCICLIVLIDILLQDGETKKYVKGVCSLMIFSVILSPIPTILNNTESFYQDVVNIEKKETISKNHDFLLKIKLKEYENLKQKCSLELKNKGISELNIDIVPNYAENGQILKIIVNTQNTVISENAMNIDINNEIKNTISRYFLVNKNIIEVIN